jgi:hypothetical protein
MFQQIGGLVAHAEAIQAAVDAAIKKGQAAQSENAEILTQIIQHAGDAVEKLEAATAQIAPRAERAATDVVAKKIQDGLSGVDSIIEGAAKKALAPLLQTLRARATEANSGREALDKSADRFGKRMLVVLVAIGLVALAMTLGGVWAALAWQRSSLASLVHEKADLQGQIREMAANKQQLESAGLKLKIRECPDSNGRPQLCVAGKPKEPQFGDERAPFYMLDY